MFLNCSTWVEIRPYSDAACAILVVDVAECTAANRTSYTGCVRHCLTNMNFEGVTFLVFIISVRDSKKKKCVHALEK